MTYVLIAIGLLGIGYFMNQRERENAEEEAKQGLHDRVSVLEKELKKVRSLIYHKKRDILPYFIVSATKVEDEYYECSC